MRIIHRTVNPTISLTSFLFVMKIMYQIINHNSENVLDYTVYQICTVTMSTLLYYFIMTMSLLWTTLCLTLYIIFTMTSLLHIFVWHILLVQWVIREAVSTELNTITQYAGTLRQKWAYFLWIDYLNKLKGSVVKVLVRIVIRLYKNDILFFIYIFKTDVIHLQKIDKLFHGNKDPFLMKTIDIIILYGGSNKKLHLWWML